MGEADGGLSVCLSLCGTLKDLKRGAIEQHLHIALRRASCEGPTKATPRIHAHRIHGRNPTTSTPSSPLHPWCQLVLLFNFIILAPPQPSPPPCCPFHATSCWRRAAHLQRFIFIAYDLKFNPIHFVGPKNQIYKGSKTI